MGWSTGARRTLIAPLLGLLAAILAVSCAVMCMRAKARRSLVPSQPLAAASSASTARSAPSASVAPSAVSPEPVGATTEESCPNQELCRKEGACGILEGVCQPTRPEHCQQSEVCREEGSCHLYHFADEPNRCRVEQQADCAGSALCRTQGRCRYAPLFAGEGRCVRARLVQTQSFALTKARHGVKGRLVIARDPRSYPDNPENYDIAINEVDPRAGAALQVLTSAGKLVDELTLYPALTVSVEDFGDGTDTFLATEQIFCSMGSCCGWDTVFLQVRSGRLSRLVAKGGHGEPTELVLTASIRSRWRLTEGAGPNTHRVVFQTSCRAVALTTQRFFPQRDGAWRYTEERADELKPGVQQEPGPWHGVLEY